MSENNVIVVRKIEVEAVAEKQLPILAEEITPLASLAQSQQDEIDALKAELDLSDSNSIIFFGTQAQADLTQLADSMLEGVRNKDVGKAAGSLNDMVATLRGFGADRLAINPGFFARIFGRARPVVQFLQQYEEIRQQIDVITDSLEGHKTQLLTDIATLDRLYDSSLDYFHTLENYIVAGDEKLKELSQDIIPKLDKEAKDSGDMIQAQKLRDLRTSRDDLERRVHDLRLTRQVTLQGLPSIRLVQENDKGLIRKIQSTVANTVPLWKQQLAQAVTIQRSRAAAETVKEAADLTNELLEKNAENLQDANREVRVQIERGVFDLASVKRANEKLIATIEDSLRIADEGKMRRAEAVLELEQIEGELKAKLLAAHSTPVVSDTVDDMDDKQG
ncbi:MAG: toxic anion resistance protein [Arenicellales bacterium]